MTGATRRQSFRLGGSALVILGFTALIWRAASLVRTHLYQEQSTAALDR